jgi:hypothetical protein
MLCIIETTDMEGKKSQIPLLVRIYQQAKSFCGRVLTSFNKAESLRELAEHYHRVLRHGSGEDLWPRDRKERQTCARRGHDRWELPS